MIERKAVPPFLLLLLILTNYSDRRSPFDKAQGERHKCRGAEKLPFLLSMSKHEVFSSQYYAMLNSFEPQHVGETQGHPLGSGDSSRRLWPPRP